MSIFCVSREAAESRGGVGFNSSSNPLAVGEVTTVVPGEDAEVRIAASNHSKALDGLQRIRVIGVNSGFLASLRVLEYYAKGRIQRFRKLLTKSLSS